jgi:tyrosyl-tRNA synthetase
MHFLDELVWRGMLQECTPGIEDYLAAPDCAGYIGFDPTAPSLGIGNYVQIMLLTLFQRSGHRPIVLMGGATGRIGDPSGKDKERELKSYEEIDRNLRRQQAQLERLLGAEGQDVRVINNYDFYRDMNVLDFLREVGKTVTVNYMMAKESVKKRIETGISFTEFSYQLIQAYDFQCLYQQYGCRLQMGGSDQWGNITSGTEFIRRNLSGKAYALTTPLLTKTDGSKFGKSETGNIWLDPELTSPYAFYQFWINADDRDLPLFTRYFTLRSQEEVLALESQHMEDPQALKRLLAEEMTERLHGAAALESARRVSQLLFHPRTDAEFLQGLSVAELEMVGREIPCHALPAGIPDHEGIDILELLAGHTPVLGSKGEVRRAIGNQAISVNKRKIHSPDEKVRREALLHGRYLLVENGKKNKYLIHTI